MFGSVTLTDNVFVRSGCSDGMGKPKNGLAICTIQRRKSGEPYDQLREGMFGGNMALRKAGAHVSRSQRNCLGRFVDKGNLHASARSVRNVG